MTAKTFEIRDCGTFIAALAVRLDPSCERDRRILSRAGFGVMPEAQSRYVFLTRLEPGEATYDPHGWTTSARTMPEAHLYIEQHFAELESGAVVDVQFILGETAAPEASEFDSTPEFGYITPPVGT